LGLALLSRGGEGMAPGELRSRIDAAGGRLELKELSYDGLALELVAPPALLPGLLDALLAAMAKPAFASPDFPAEEWDGAMRDFRVRLMKDYGDPAVQASTAIRSEVYPGHPYAVPPLGTAQSLLSLTRAEVASQWKALVGSERIAIAVAGDLDPEALAAMAVPRLASLGRRGPDPVPPPPLPIKNALILIPRSGASGTYLKVEYLAPPLSSPDYPALLVGLSALQDLVLEEVRGGDPQAYGVTTRLSASASPSASIQVSRGKGGERAKAAVERAVRLLASGASLSTTGAGLAPLKDSLEAYKLGTLSRTYTRADSAADMALRMARDLCAGGDGSTWFRLADRIGAVRAEDIQRVVREGLVDGPKAWAVAGPPSLLAELKAVPVSAVGP
jgi:zinc protease